MPRPSTTLLPCLLVALLALVPAVVKWLGYPDYPGFDDAFIHLAIVKNFIAGHGWGVNPDHAANMTSCPLYTLVMAALAFGLGNEILVGMLLSAALGSAALVLMYRTARLLELPRGLALAATTVAAFDFVLWRWYGTVMETTMTYLTLGVVLYVYYRGFGPRQRGRGALLGLGLLVGLAVLVRIELAVLAPAIAIDLLLNRREGAVKSVLWVALGSVLAIVPWLGFAWREFGDVVPTTYYSKASGGLLLWNPTVLLQVASVVGASHLAPVLLAAGTVAVWVRRGGSADLRKVLRKRAALFLAPVFYLSFYYLNTELLGSAARYVLPALYPLPLAIFVLLNSANPLGIGARTQRFLLLSLLLHCGMNLFIDVQRVQPVLRGYGDNYWRVMRETSEYLAERCEPSDHLLVVVDIGILAYYGEGRYHIDDAYQLASPELRGIPYEDLIEHTQPKFVVLTQGTPEGAANPPPVWEQYLLDHPDLVLDRTREYAATGIAEPDRRFECRVYRRRNP